MQGTSCPDFKIVELMLAVGNADGVFRAREIKRLEPESRWDKEAVKNLIGVLWRLTEGRVARPEIRVDPIPIPPLPFEGP